MGWCWTVNLWKSRLVCKLDRDHMGRTVVRKFKHFGAERARGSSFGQLRKSKESTTMFS